MDATSSGQGNVPSHANAGATLPFIVRDDTDAKTKGWFFSSDDRVDVSAIPVDKLQSQFATLTESLSKVFENAKSVGAFRLKTIEIGVEISSEGGINLIGTASVGAKAAVKIVFHDPE